MNPDSLPLHSGYLETGTLANSEAPDEMLPKTAFHQVLYCLHAKIETVFRDRNI